MADREEEQAIYIIPENYIEGGRIINGTFRTRFFIEAIILAAIQFIIFFLLTINMIRELRIVIIVLFSAGTFLLALFGINGDPLTVYVRNAFRWLKGRKLMLFNTSPQPLTESPMDSKIDRSTLTDKLLDAWDSHREKVAAKMTSENLVRGTDYEFLQETEIQNHLYKPSEDSQGDDLFISFMDEEEENEITLLKTQESDVEIFISPDTQNDLDELRKEVFRG